MKGPTEKTFEGIYANPRLMHAIGLVVGCVAHVRVKSGSLYEGVLKTISSKADFVLEMVHKLENGKISNSVASPASLAPIADAEEVYDKLVFKFDDIVMITASNVDPDFATRESFTDTAISKYNGQVTERELEPWDGGSLPSENLSDLGTGEEEANGWDAIDMFRTNEEKYGVKSSFDSTLQGYTIPLNKQNTEEYKQQEAKASKIAQEIESSFYHKSRAALENGDEEDRFSAVLRPDTSFRFVPHRRKLNNVNRNMNRNNPPPSHGMNRTSHPHTQPFHRVSSPATNSSQGNYKMASTVSTPTCVNSISVRPTPSSTPPVPRQSPGIGTPLQTSQSPMQFQQGPPPASAAAPVTATPAPRSTPPTTPNAVPQEETHKINGEVDKTEVKFAPKPPRSLNLQTSANKEVREAVGHQQITNKSLERRKDSEKKIPVQKTRDDKTEELKRFHSRFKLSEDTKDVHDKENICKVDTLPSVNSAVSVPPKHGKEKSKDEDRKIDNSPDSRTSPDNPKSSTLNPNAKEFVLNPNAKSFTPRVIPVQNMQPMPTVQPPPRLHTQSPIMAMPQPHLMPGMTQTVFNMPHYVVSATPVTVPVGPSFTPAASVAQPPRLRKAVPMTLQRHDLSQPVHVQAATGQPILAQPTALSAPQFALQYAPSPGMIHHPPGPPQQLAYAQMYSLMPRVLAPQAVGMVPTSAAYGDSPQLPTHVYMHPGVQTIPHAIASASSGQHSAPSTPQSQTPSLHPAPSPVHQAPPSGNPHGQPPTPTGHPSNAPTPQPVLYGHMAAGQHPAALHAAGHSASGGGHHFAAASYSGTPQPIVILPQQPHAPHPATFASSLQNHLHSQNSAGHMGTPTHVLPHTPLAMIPTSAGLVHTQTAISSGHYVPHSQV